VNGLDRFIRARRIAQATRYVRPGSRVLDIGCHDGELFRVLGPALREGLGLDPDLAGPLSGPAYSLVPGTFPEDLPDRETGFDAVCVLAVLEHVPESVRPVFAAAIANALLPGGEAILTVPSPAVDGLLDTMIRVGLADGMEAEQHHGFDVAEVQPLFEGEGLVLEHHHRFQLGLNNLYVFRKPR
jgi:SAM-dependent methyltransferase